MSKCKMTWRVGVLFNPRSWWVGAHYSPYNGRWCINVVPCVTLWICKPGGFEP